MCVCVCVCVFHDSSLPELGAAEGVAGQDGGGGHAAGIPGLAGRGSVGAAVA